MHCVDLGESFPTRSNEYLLDEIVVDTAENEPLDVRGKIEFIFHSPPWSDDGVRSEVWSPRPRPGNSGRPGLRAMLGDLSFALLGSAVLGGLGWVLYKTVLLEAFCLSCFLSEKRGRMP